MVGSCTSIPVTRPANWLVTALRLGGRTMAWRRIPKGKKLLVLCDGGGSNSSSRYVFREGLQKLSNRLSIEVRIAHYPPYCSFSQNTIRSNSALSACDNCLSKRDFAILENSSAILFQENHRNGPDNQSGHSWVKSIWTGTWMRQGFAKKLESASDRNASKWKCWATFKSIE